MHEQQRCIDMYNYVHVLLTQKKHILSGNRGLQLFLLTLLAMDETIPCSITKIQFFFNHEMNDLANSRYMTF